MLKNLINSQISKINKIILGIDVDYYVENKNFENIIQIFKNSIDNYSL